MCFVCVKPQDGADYSSCPESSSIRAVTRGQPAGDLSTGMNCANPAWSLGKEYSVPSHRMREMVGAECKSVIDGLVTEGLDMAWAL
jgi:hypothetical protein